MHIRWRSSVSSACVLGIAQIWSIRMILATNRGCGDIGMIRGECGA